MQSYYKQPVPVPGQNGPQQAAATAQYYAQMAQHPQLYALNAQMWAGQVRATPPSVNPASRSLPFRSFLPSVVPRAR